MPVPPPGSVYTRVQVNKVWGGHGVHRMPPEESSLQKSFCRRHYKVLRKVSVVVVLTLYLVLGAVVFHFLEAKAETERQQNAALKLHQLLENLTCISHEDIQQLLSVATELKGAKVSQDTKTGLAVQFPPGQWSVDRALFFSMTVLTTIGYGNLVPKTPRGQTFCLFYALFGIPLFLLVLANIGCRIAQRNLQLTAWLFGSRLTQGSHTFCTARFTLLVLVGLPLMLLLPSVVFMYAEGWTYPESFYFAFITLSTIGFGDYVIGTGSHMSVWLVFALWIPVGLAWFSALISTVQHILAEKIVPYNSDCSLEDEQGTPQDFGEPDPISNTQDIQKYMVQDSCQQQQQQQQQQQHQQLNHTQIGDVNLKDHRAHLSSDKDNIHIVQPQTNIGFKI